MFCTGYEITKDNFEEAIAECERKGLTPRLVVLTNPNNPLGVCMEQKQILDVIEWSREHAMHILVDEIYACCLYKEPSISGFQSVASMRTSDGGFPMDKQDVHVVWGLSKDFCVSGFRVGVLFTKNEKLLNYIGAIGGMTAVSNVLQVTLAKMFEDDEFLDSFLRANNEALARNSAICCDFFHLNEIKFVDPSAGTVLWCNLILYV